MAVFTALARTKSPRNHGIARIPALLGIFLAFSAPSIFAIDPTHISQYGHNVWRIQDGYFGGAPRGIAQTTDGYIWVGTEAGLFKFDGVRFERWSAQSGGEPVPAVRDLLSARDGSLWIGTEAGLAHLVNGRLTVYEKGWLSRPIIQDRDGKIWFSHVRAGDKTHPLCQVLRDEVHCYGGENGIPFGVVGSMAQDASGDLWLGSERTLALWRPGSGVSNVYRPQSLQSNGGYMGVMAITPAAGSPFWVGVGTPGRGGGLQRMVDGTLKPFRAPKLNGETLDVSGVCIDRQGNTWVGTPHGLYKIHGADVDHYGVTEGLSSDRVAKILEDREGNVWVVTTEGLDMFHELRVKTISAREGLILDGVSSVAAAHDGQLWIGTTGVQVLEPKDLTLEKIAALQGDQIASLLFDHSGRPWVGMNNKLFVREQGRFREIAKPDGSALGMIMGITEDSEHDTWVETAGPPATLVRIDNLKVREMFPAPETPVARKIVADPHRGIWLGLVTGDLARFRDGQVETFTFGEHPNARVIAITAASDGSIMGGTPFGVVAWKNGNQQILTTKNGLPCNYVSALISDDVGNLWLFSQCGLVEIPREQMELWWQHSESRLNLRMFDAFDGFRPGVGYFNTSAKTPDGRLWFANGSVLQEIDPANVSQNPVPPPVQISAVVADRKPYSMDSGIKLPALTRDLEIDYTALSYTAPQKVLFRYMLEGRDSRLQEAGTRRQAFYNDLRPGHYRFRVVACNNDGVWREAGASLDFSVLPAFYQTSWFFLLCAAAVVMLAWAAYRWRIGQVSARLDSQFKGRLAERTRIAQELHDTLLQGFMSASMQLSVANRQLPADLPAKVIVADVLEQMKNVIEEGRSAIRGMRLSSTNSDDLEPAFLKMPQDLAVQERMNFKVIVEGQSRPLHPLIRDEVCRIGREAVANAFHHANASVVEAEIEYGDNQLRLVVRDNGCGIDPETLKSGRDGHWGLSGMRERAKVVGAGFKIWSNSAGGTEVELVVPGQVAYRDGSGKRPARWLMGFLRKDVRSDSENKISQ